jgi:hypothetical protein
VHFVTLEKVGFKSRKPSHFFGPAISVAVIFLGEGMIKRWKEFIVVYGLNHGNKGMLEGRSQSFDVAFSNQANRHIN